MTKEEAIQILDLVIELLTPEEKWTKEGAFDEECLITSNQFTLSCALKLMQLSVIGKYESRNLVMRQVRRTIVWNFFWRQGFHPLHSFNKHKKTNYSELMWVLNKAKSGLS